MLLANNHTDRMKKLFTSAATRSTTQHITNNKRPSFGFSGAGFLGCYHVGVCAALHKHGLLPHPDDDSSYNTNKMPLLTGVSAGSMIAAATLAGVHPENDGMNVVLEAARRTRELNSQQSVSLDVLTPGFSLIDQVEGPFRDAMAKSLGGYCQTDKSSGNTTIHDIDPDLFDRRYPEGTLRIGLTDRRGLLSSISGSYRYVDKYRNLEDVIACSMLSSYIPGITGPLNLKDKVPTFLGDLLNAGASNADDNTVNTYGVDASDRAGLLLKEMTQLGHVKHGKTGLPVVENETDQVKGESEEDDTTKKQMPEATIYWDGGIADVFPTIDKDTVIVAPVNGLFDNPAICPRIPNADTIQEQQYTSSSLQQPNNALLQNYLLRYIPTTFRHCSKSQLGLNTQNAYTALKMIFSSDDDELYLRFQEGYDDAK